MGCNIRVDLTTGVPEYKEYLESISWATRCGLCHCGGDNTISYFGSQTRKYPKAIWPAMIKVKPESALFTWGIRRLQRTSPLGRRLLPISLKDSLRFCITSGTMRMHTQVRGSCRGTSVGRSSFSTAAWVPCPLSSLTRSPRPWRRSQL